MLLLRVWIFSFLVFGICLAVATKQLSRIERQSASSALQQTVENFSSLSRLVNAISLQQALLDGSAKPNDVIAELLDIESGDAVVKLIGTEIDANKIRGNLDKAYEHVSKLKDNPVKDSSKVREAVLDLEFMKQRVDVLKKIVNVDGFTNEAKDYISSSSVFIENLKIVTFSNVLNDLNSLKTNNPDVDDVHTITEAMRALEQLSIDLPSLLKELQAIPHHEVNLKTFYDQRDLYKKADSIFAISQVGRKYMESYRVLSIFQSTMKSAQEDGKVLLPIMREHETYSKIGQSLEKLALFLATLNNVRETSKIYSLSFPNGATDLNQIYADLKSLWLKETIAEGKEMLDLSDSLSLLLQICERVKQFIGNWEKTKHLLNSSSSVANFSALFNDLSSAGKLLIGFTDLDKTFNTLSNNVKNFKPINGSPVFSDFEKIYSNLKIMGDKASFVEKSFKEIVSSKHNNVVPIVSALISALSNVKSLKKPSDIVEKVKQIRKIKDLDKLALSLGFIFYKLKPELTTLLLNISTTNYNWESISSVQKCLENTGLEAALENLKNAKHDPNGIEKLLEFGLNVRRIKKERIQNVKDIVELAEKLRANLTAMRETMAKSTTSKSKRAVALKKMENSQSLMKEFATGINALRKLSDVLAKKVVVSTAADSPNEVNNLIAGLLEMQSSWTQENRDGMKKLLDDLTKLDKYAQDHITDKDLMEYGSILSKASEIIGVPIDTSLIGKSVVPALEASQNSKIKGATPTFTELSQLELDYFKHSVSIKAFFLSLVSIRKYFDDVFGIQRDPSKAVGGNNGGISLKTVLFICAGAALLILIVIAGLFLFCNFCKSRCEFLQERSRFSPEYLKALQDPELWVHLSYTNENEPFEYKKLLSIKAFIHIWKDNLKAFKKCLKNGAYVDARVQNSVFSNTLLHECVSQGRPAYMEVLNKHGATVDLLNHERETPMDMAFRLKKHDCLAVLRKYKNKKFQIVFPEPLSERDYLIDVDEQIPVEENFRGDFFEKFGQYAVPYGKRATHYVARTDVNNVLHVDEYHLPFIFSASMIMGHYWLKACCENSAHITDNKQFRVTKMQFQGKVYDTVVQIKDFINRMNVPYLMNSGVSYFDQFYTDDWCIMRKVASQLGDSGGSGQIPIVCPKEGYAYHRQEMSRNIVIYRPHDKEKVKAIYNKIWKNNAHYHFMDTDQFTHFLLSFKFTKINYLKRDELVKSNVNQENQKSERDRKNNKNHLKKLEKLVKKKHLQTEQSQTTTGTEVTRSTNIPNTNGTGTSTATLNTTGTN